jgi:hypothetical protein
MASTIYPLPNLPSYPTSATISENKGYQPDMSGYYPAIAFTDAELSVFYAVFHVLRSHKNLTESDVEYAANYISSFYAYSQDRLQIDPKIPPIESPILSDDQLIMFLVYADRSGICKFALIFNDELDLAIRTRNDILLKSIVTGPREMFIELYDNAFLNQEDREFVIRLVSREIFAMNLTFELLKRKIINLEQIDLQCLSETMSSHIEQDRQGIHMSTLTTKCYDEVCIQDARILEDDLVRASMSRYEKTPSSVYTVDKPINSSTPQVFCFETLELIAAMTEEIPINPRTRQPFSQYSVQIIYQRFRKEIEMYRRYKQIKQLQAK